MSTTLTRPAQPAPRSVAPPRRSWVREHGPFGVALVLGALMRVWVQLAFSPALVHSDGPVYLDTVRQLAPGVDRPSGYVLLVLAPLARLRDDVLLVSVAQHVLGMFTAIALYVLLRRWSVRRWPATLATLPLLLDTLALNLEHSVLSDTLFVLLVVSALVLLLWRRRLRWPLALAGGVVTGVSVTVRLVGQDLLPVALLAALALGGAGGRGWRGRAGVALALCLGMLMPVAAYATWYHQAHGVYALSGASGRAVYARSTTFVDCATVRVPDYQRVLCPREPVGARRDPTYYAFHDPRTLPRLRPPAGTSVEEGLREFALAAVKGQPVDYSSTAVRDLALNFDVSREDRFEHETAFKWGWTNYLTVAPTDWTRPAYAAHGGRQLSVHQPWADALAAYGRVGYTPGPVLAGCLVLALLAGLGVGRARRSGLRSATWVLLLAGAGLIAAPAFTAEFVWRYQLPALALLPAAAALAWTALRGQGPGRGQASGVRATASTD